MLISVCVFGYEEAGKKFVELFRAIPGYGIKFRIHMVQVKDLRELMPSVLLNAKGQWKLHDEFFEDTEMGISFGDDLEWLRESGWEGHDVIVDCSAESDDFEEEIDYQVNKHQRMKLYRAKKVEEVEALVEELEELMDSRLSDRE